MSDVPACRSETLETLRAEIERMGELVHVEHEARAAAECELGTVRAKCDRLSKLLERIWELSDVLYDIHNWDDAESALHDIRSIAAEMDAAQPQAATERDTK